MVGVLVETEVGHQHQRLAHLLLEIPQRHLDDAVPVPGLGALSVLAGGDAEEDHRRDAEPGQLAHLLAQRLARVLDDARQRRHWRGRRDVLAHEQRCDQVVDIQPRFGDKPAHGGCASEAA